MRRFIAVLLCFYFAAQGSLAQICERVDSVDMTILERAFANGAARLPVPTLEINDQSAGAYKMNFVRAVTAYCSSLVTNLYQQAVTQGDVLTEGINTLVDELLWSIQMMLTNQGVDGVYDIEALMKSIVTQFQTLLVMSPGPGRPVQTLLSPLPRQMILLDPVQQPLSPRDLFVNYNTTLDKMSSNIYSYTGTIYRAGWNSTLSYYDVLGMQVRNQILNNGVLDLYRQAALQINTQSDFIQNNIDPALWKSYISAVDSIEAAWNAYQLYKSQVACIAYS